ncbi:MAG: tetratricopeptide repeat protein, partial [Proteobacteria bacterium]|nr:tetratricopeptide repeat protein [Pseudomonadota bacterium]
LMLHNRAEIWKDKLSLWSDVIKKSPYKARPHMNLAHALDLEGRHEEAARGYTIALKFSRDGSASAIEILRNLGVARFRLGQLPEAIGIFRRVLIFEPDNVDILNNLSICLLETGRHDEALSTALHAEGVIPNHGEINSTLGEIYLAIKEYPKALGYFRKALKLNPDVPVRYFNAALALEKMGRLSEACLYWEQYLDLEKSVEESRLVDEHMTEIACP